MTPLYLCCIIALSNKKYIFSTEESIKIIIQKNCLMEAKLLKASKHTNPQTGFLCRYVKSNTERFKLHYHDYYELFLILKGNVAHTVNSQTNIIRDGHLLFIRDRDVHNYQSADGNSFEFINLAFTKQHFNALFEYLGEAFPYTSLLNTSFPPMTILSQKKKNSLFYSLLNLSHEKDIISLHMEFRIVLFQIFSQYFFNYSEDVYTVPVWLEVAYQKMKKPINFIAGLNRMIEVSGKSYEHLARSLKQYYNVTPTQYIADLRLEYAANMLYSSNLSVTEICFSCGFENMSWFHKQFKEKYGVTPSQYRKNIKYIN